MGIAYTDPVELTGPNLTLADLRFLVARCAALDGASRVAIHERDQDPTRYERIVITPAERET